MRIGILTLPFNNNYGGYLQAFALIRFLKLEGHDVTLIYRKHNRRSFTIRFRHLAKAMLLGILGKPHKRFLMDQEVELREKGALIMPFVDKWIFPITKPLYSDRELRKIAKGKFDIVIVGSDQVWRPDYGPQISNYFFDFVDDSVRKISYAASFGSDNPKYTPKEKTICASLLSNFEAISVREESGISIINKWNLKSDVSPKVVLDPTMLLGVNSYLPFLKPDLLSKGKIFCYVLDDSEIASEMIESVSRLQNIEAYHIIDVSKWKKEDYIMPSMESWLSGIYFSNIVITDSFHGTVFSILFNKPFIVYANVDRGLDRFDTLLKVFDLQSRIAKSKEDAIRISNEKINWKQVNLILENKRKESAQFLIDSIQKV